MIISESDLLRKALTITTEIERINESLHRLLTTAGSQDHSKASHAIEETTSKKSAKPNKPSKPAKVAKEAKATKVTSTVLKKLAKKSSLKISKANAKTRAASPSGSLGDAILKVLEEKGLPMKVKEVFDALEKTGYQWTNDKPLRQLYARIAKLPGAIRVGNAEYALESTSRVSSKETPKPKVEKEAPKAQEIPTSSEISKEEAVSNNNVSMQESIPSLEKPLPLNSSDIKSEIAEATIIVIEEESTNLPKTDTTSLIY